MAKNQDRDWCPGGLGFSNPVIQRELIGTLRGGKAAAALLATALVCTLLIALRWPSDARVDLSGSQARQVFQLFGYGLLTCLLLLAPAFPATSIVRERRQGTLALLLNTPLTPWSIYLGKLLAHLGLVLLLVSMSLPAAAACYAMGGLSLAGDLARLYGVLALAAWQVIAVALLVSTLARTADAALRISYGCVLLLAIVSLGPHYFLQGTAGWKALGASWLRCLSPVPAVMELVGHSRVGAAGIGSAADVVFRFMLLAAGSSLLFAAAAVIVLHGHLLDRSRWQGVITDQRAPAMQWLRRLWFLVDPQRRKSSIGPLINPVMVKEFRCRRFGRMHWLLRLVAASALVSLGLTYAATMGTLDWGVETIGGIMVLLQAALIVGLTPSLAAGLISGEIESGGWPLLQMTPLSAGRILRGKLASVLWPVVLLLVSTLPGYVVMVLIQPDLWLQIRQVLICLAWTGVLAISVSFACSSLFSRTAVATAVAYASLAAICAGTMLVWALRDAPFGYATVETVLRINPVAAALSVMGTPGFAPYGLVPGNWWCMGLAAAGCALVVWLRTRRLMQPW